MENWGGAQWLMVFIIAFRSVFGAAMATGQLIFAGDNPPLGWKWWRRGRFVDGALVAILVWGGFF